MRTILLLLFLPLSISSYNLVTSGIWEETSGSDEFSIGFGSSVGLYSHKRNSSSPSETWLLIGDSDRSLGNKEIGRLWYSEWRNRNRHQFEIRDSETNIFNGTHETSLVRSWLGASMDVNEKIGLITACAPKTTLILKSHEKIEDETLQGVCYTGTALLQTLEVQDFSTYERNNNPITGFAVHYPRSKNDLDSVSAIVGSPMHHNVGAVHTLGNRKWTTLEDYTGHYISLFGYAISSGYYFDELQLMIAGGAPGWNLVGQVAIMKHYRDDRTTFPIISKINGTELGEYFGSSLATGDLNNDGLEDLIVGAPHWKNDNGRVYIYLGDKAGFSKADIVLEGRVDDALFGYTLSSGDLDNDGFDDLIVAAPWEHMGVIYVYNGDNLQVHGSIKRSQKIELFWFTFGLSLSKLVDIDDNGYRDVTVGAAGTAGVFRSRPVVKTMITLSTVPPILSRNSTRFVVKFCITNDPNIHFDGVIRFTVDKHHDRVTEMISKIKISGSSKLQYCGEKTMYLQNNHNYMEDIEIVAEYNYNISKHDCERLKGWIPGGCPVKYKNQNPSAHTMLPFDLDCGDDRICQTSINAKLEFQGIRNSTYTIGSNDLDLLLMLQKDGEPAYSTSVIFHIPEGVFLNSLLPSCYEERGQQTMIVKCDVGDLMIKHEQRNITLNLAMSHLFKFSLNESKLNFIADIKTASANQGLTKVAITLPLEANVSIGLSGETHNNIGYLELKNLPSTLAFQHHYRISKFGTTPISKLLLKVLVPHKVGCLKFMKTARIPHVFISDHVYECKTSNILVSAKKIESSSTTHITKTDEHANQMPCENMLSPSETQGSEVIHLNCSTPNVVCEQIECEISFPSTANSIGKLPFLLNIKMSELIGHTKEKNFAIHFTTEASVHPLNPKIPFTVPGIGINFPLTTIFHVTPNSVYVHNIYNTIMTPKKPEIDIQLILGSVTLGLLILSLLVLILERIGFFERKMKEAMKLAKNEMEMHNLAPKDQQKA